MTARIARLPRAALILTVGVLAVALITVLTVFGAGAIAQASPSNPRAVGAAPAKPPQPVVEYVPAPNAAALAMLQYVHTYWNQYNLAQYGSLPTVDCADFTSQALHARGWPMDAKWWAKGNGDDYTFSRAWVSSTALMHYLEGFPDRATRLTDADRALVKPGDIVQFDWDNSGDRDHTGIVSKVEIVDGTVKIFYAGHTTDTLYRTVDFAITRLHPGATVYYWSLD